MKIRFPIPWICWLIAIPLQAQPFAKFSATESDSVFRFETDFMTGEVRGDGPYHGVTRLTHKTSARQFIDERYSALNLFKLMSTNLVMDQPRKMERSIKLTDDGAMEITWPLSDGFAGTVKGRYEISCRDAIDLTITTSVKAPYRGFEVFLSSYFDKELHPYVFLKDRGPKPATLILPTYNPVFANTVLVFPRDSHAARPCLDGRWERSERKEPHVQMTPVRHYAKCLAFMADSEKNLGVVLTALPTDCYAISTRYFSENPKERNTTYSAFDLSLFGDDFAAGGSRSVRVRMTLTELDEKKTRPFEIYESYVEESKKE